MKYLVFSKNIYTFDLKRKLFMRMNNGVLNYKFPHSLSELK